MPISESILMASLSGRHSVARSARRTACTATGPFAEIFSATSRARSSAVPSGTTSPMRPISFASGARRCRPVSRMSAATA